MVAPAIIAAGITAAGSVAGGYLGGRGQSSTTTPYWNKQTRPYGKDLMYQAGQLSQMIPPYYPGPTAVGSSPLQNMAFQQAPNAYNLGLGAWGQGMQNMGQAAGFMSNPAILSPDSNPYLKQYGGLMGQQLSQNLQENIMPGLRSSAIGAGQYGGTRQGIAEGLAAGRTQEAYQRGLTDLYSRGYGQGLQAMGQGGQLAGQSMGYAGMPQALGSNLYNMGSGMQAQAQRMRDADVARYNYYRDAPWNNLERYANIAAPLINMSGNVSKTTGAGDPYAGAYAGGQLGNWLASQLGFNSPQAFQPALPNASPQMNGLGNFGFQSPWSGFYTPSNF